MTAAQAFALVSLPLRWPALTTGGALAYAAPMGFSKIQKVDYRKKVWSMRLAGRKPREIAAELGISLSYVKLLTARGLRDAREEAQRACVDHVAESQDRLSVAMGAIWEGVEAGDTKAIQTYLQIEDRRAKLLGLDAAAKVKIGGPSEGDGMGPIPIVISPAQSKV